MRLAGWRAKLLVALLIALSSMLAGADCGHLETLSFKQGTFSFLSTSIVSALTGGQVSALVSNSITGGIFTPGITGGLTPGLTTKTNNP